MNCPHCNKQLNYNHIPINNATTNAEYYGSSRFTFKCAHCKKKLSVYIQRVVKVNPPEIAPDDAELSYW